MRYYLVATVERFLIDCPVTVLPPNTDCGTCTCIAIYINHQWCNVNTDSELSNATYCNNNDQPFVGIPQNDHDCNDDNLDDKCAWKPCES